jgi:hypothetical protein
VLVICTVCVEDGIYRMLVISGNLLHFTMV